MNPLLADESPSWDRVRSLPAERLLATLAGACALGFGVLAFVLDLVDGGKNGPFGFGGASGAILTLAIVGVFGLLVLAWGMRSTGAPREWSVTVAAFSLVLLIFGGIAGAIGGILGLVAAGTVFVRELRTA